MSAEDRAAGPAGETGGREETGNTKNHHSSPGDRPALQLMMSSLNTSTFIINLVIK